MKTKDNVEENFSVKNFKKSWEGHDFGGEILDDAWWGMRFPEYLPDINLTNENKVSRLVKIIEKEFILWLVKNTGGRKQAPTLESCQSEAPSQIGFPIPTDTIRRPVGR